IEPPAIETAELRPAATPDVLPRDRQLESQLATAKALNHKLRAELSAAQKKTLELESSNRAYQEEINQLLGVRFLPFQTHPDNYPIKASTFAASVFIEGAIPKPVTLVNVSYALSLSGLPPVHISMASVTRKGIGIVINRLATNRQAMQV